MAYFIYEPCHPSTKSIVKLLKMKARQGVHVRFLLDAFMYKKQMREWMALDFAQAGIEFKLFNPRFTLHPDVNFRMHIKLLLIDQRTYISGGRNIADEYFGLSPIYNFIDSDVWVSGKSANQATKVFEELWANRRSKSISVDKLNPENQKNICPVIDTSREQKWQRRIQKYISETSQEIVDQIPVHRCPKTKFVADNPDFRKYRSNNANDGSILNEEMLKQKKTTFEFLEFIRRTTQSLEMENWSYMPLDLINQELKHLRNKHVPILVMTNLDADNMGIIKNAEDYLNHKFAQRDTLESQVVIQLASKGRLSDRHRLTPQSSFFRLHQKTGLRDGQDIMIGSFNIDPRSYHTNLESMVVLEDCPSLAQDYTDHASNLVRTFNQDYQEGNMTPHRPPGLSTVLFSIFGFHFL